jgi:hypothetical protein
VTSTLYLKSLAVVTYWHLLLILTQTQHTIFLKHWIFGVNKGDVKSNAHGVFGLQHFLNMDCFVSSAFTWRKTHIGNWETKGNFGVNGLICQMPTMYNQTIQ